MLALTACGKAEFGIAENSWKHMTITAQNADKDAFFMAGSLDVVDGEQIEISANPTKGSVRVEIIRSPDNQSVYEIPEMEGAAIITANLVNTDGVSGTVPAGTYLLRATCLEKATGTIQIEVKTAGNAFDQSPMTFEEYLERSGENWFLTGKQEYTIQAMMVSKEISFHNELEVVDYTVTDDGVTVILKGRFGEMWATKLSKVLSTYTKLDGSELSEADFAVRDVWVNITTRPEPEAYYAMFVPLEISVAVETAWGDVLHTNLPNAPHGDGDYLLCRVGENGQPDLSDVWVVNGVIFPEYYSPAIGDTELEPAA